ncbi:hypothetical protein [Paenibacillus sp. Marseille-Q4541]|uniref:DUF6115 domain-containing protein n=1 Tax=Paenibacillus sp. Marseille-Q4541 TaxID=2831522 RepID=UPI001BAA690D|nr:hypothetical protein [Paenibacillus sp. Marseille-Q4541]
MQPWSTLVVLGVCVILFAWFMPKSKPESGQTLVKEVETALEQYLAEIELENEKVIESIQKWKQDSSHMNNLREKEIQDLKIQLQSLEDQVSSMHKAAENPDLDSRLDLNESLKEEETNHVVDESVTLNEQHSIHTRFAEIFRLESQGKSTDFIARKLAMPKGEVQLILQLGERENIL